MNIDHQNSDWKRAAKQQLFRDAEDAAKEQDFPRLAVAYHKLASFHAMLEQFRAHEPALTTQASAPFTMTLETPPSDKERGERVRTNWVTKYLGSKVAPLRGALYRTTTDETLGIAYGEEKKGREDRWFLGLPAGKFQSAVLLCQPLSGNLFWFALPKEFINKHNFRLSKSKVGQVKFSIFKRGDNYSLQVPHVGSIPIGEYLNKTI